MAASRHLKRDGTIVEDRDGNRRRSPWSFVAGFGVDDEVWDHSTFSKNRDRLLDGEIVAKFLNAVLAQPQIKRLLSSEHFSVDGRLIAACASMKSFRPKDPPIGGRAALGTAGRLVGHIFIFKGDDSGFVERE